MIPTVLGIAHFLDPCRVWGAGRTQYFGRSVFLRYWAYPEGYGMLVLYNSRAGVLDIILRRCIYLLWN